MELRAIVWIVTKGSVIRHRCAVLCGGVEDEPSLHLTVVAAKHIVDEAVLRLAEEEESSEKLDAVLSQESIVQRLATASRLPLFNAMALSDIQCQVDNQRVTVSAAVVQSSFFDSVFHDLRIGVKF
jgi:ribulose 1,5-bisphosphate synthetase/thiazole synthase